MKKYFKKFIAVFMVVIMAVVCVPVMDIGDMFGIEASALTGSGNMGGNVSWKYDTSSKTLTISGSGNMSNYSSTPSAFTKYNAKLVCTISKNVTKIVINSGVTSIGNYAFADLTKVTSVTIAGSVTSIGSNAFKGCTSLSSVTVSSGVKTIGERAFYGCTALKSITIPASVTTLGKSAFEGCSNLSSVSFSEGLTTVGAYCFKNTKFASVALPSTVTSIGDYAFAGISNLSFRCTYGNYVYNYCKNNSYAYTLNSPVMLIDSQFDTDNMQVIVTLKLVFDRNGSAINAGNFTFTYNDSVIPVNVPDTGYSYSYNGNSSTAIVYGTDTVSVAVMAESATSYETSGYETSYTLAQLEFNVNGQADAAQLTLTADTLMLNGSKKTATAADVSINLHSYDAPPTVVKSANCHEKGSMYYTCSLCQKEVYEDIAIDPSVHDGGSQLQNVLAETCGTNGYTGDVCCKGCGGVITSGKDIPATGNHNHSVSVTKTATCIATGEKTYVCSVCDDTYTETVAIDASNHVGDTEIRNAKEATCSEDGYTGDEYCKSCNTNIKSGSVIKSTGKHTAEVRNAKEASCFEDGYTGDSYCKYCNTLMQSGTVIKAAGEHSYTSKVITQATCTSAGETEYTCTVCGDSYTETVESGHEYVAVVTAPTCTSAGYTVYTCSLCDASYRGDNVASLGHEYGENGECVRCGDVKITAISFGDSASVTVDNDAKTVVSKLNALKASEFIAMIEGEGWTVCGEDGNAVADDTFVSTGCKIKHSSGSVEYTLIILGDVNLDGKVTAADARLVLRKSAQLQDLTELQTLAADVDINEKVTASDARIILRVSAQMQQF